jgi:hypothetical protein
MIARIRCLWVRIAQERNLDGETALIESFRVVESAQPMVNACERHHRPCRVDVMVSKARPGKFEHALSVRQGFSMAAGLCEFGDATRYLLELIRLGANCRARQKVEYHRRARDQPDNVETPAH